MVGSIDPRCETVRGTHWPKPGRVVDWNSRRGNHLGQRFKPTASTGRTYGCKRSDLTQKTLVPRGPSTYGSLLLRGRRRGVHKKNRTARSCFIVITSRDLNSRGDRSCDDGDDGGDGDDGIGEAR